MKKPISGIAETLCWLAAAVVAVCLALLIGGCAREPHVIRGSGEATLPPMGWIIFCQENPKHKACGPVEPAKGETK
jgi:hypothetical protein